MESFTFIQWCLENLNYGTITLLMVIESSFIPFPSEIVVPPAAYLAAHGQMNIFLVVFFATLGALLGALANYYLALWIGRPLVFQFANSSLGRFCLLNGEKVNRAEAYFAKHGALSTFIGRLVPGVRQLISIPAGLSRMKMGPFILYTVLGAALWNIILAAMGYYLARVLPREMLMEKVCQYSREVGCVFIVLAVAALCYLAYKGLNKKNEGQ